VFVDESDPDAFGFLDPGQVVWGAHLIPTFASGRGTSSHVLGGRKTTGKSIMSECECG
jgi:hypothetical protein